MRCKGLGLPGQLCHQGQSGHPFWGYPGAGRVGSFVMVSALCSQGGQLGCGGCCRLLGPKFAHVGHSMCWTSWSNKCSAPHVQIQVPAACPPLSTARHLGCAAWPHLGHSFSRDWVFCFCKDRVVFSTAFRLGFCSLQGVVFVLRLGLGCLRQGVGIFCWGEGWGSCRDMAMYFFPAMFFFMGQGEAVCCRWRVFYCRIFLQVRGRGSSADMLPTCFLVLSYREATPWPQGPCSSGSCLLQGVGVCFWG